MDIVDENNNLTGERAPRNKVHSEGLWHRTVHIYLFRKNNGEIEFLVHLRSPLKDMHPNKWDTRFGGHIKSGVTLEEGIKSELEEEIGLAANVSNLIEGEWYKHDKFPNKEFSKVYFLEYSGNPEDLKFNDGEVQKVRWMSIQEIKDYMKNNYEECSASITGFTEIVDYLSKKI